jgi:hypothetical protein
MTVAAPLLFPGSRTLSGWWRQLAHWQPRGLWIGHLLLHRIEALVNVTRPRRLDPFMQFVLRALRLDEINDASERPGLPQGLERIQSRVPLERPFLVQVLRRLQSEGLVPPDAVPGRWLTALGQQAVEQDAYPQTGPERRVFYFLDGGRPGRRAHFLNLRRHGAAPCPPREGWEFEVTDLEACIRQSAAWKRQHGFPEEVQELVGTTTTSPTPWHSVVLDRAERLVAAFVVAAGEAGGERLFGFGVQEETWILEASEPILVLGAGWQEPFPEMAHDVPLDSWREAWQAWCQPRGLPTQEVNTCGLERQGHRLKVLAPAPFVERLQMGRGDAVRGKAWILAGGGAYRAAALIEISAKSQGPVPSSG